MASRKQDSEDKKKDSSTQQCEEYSKIVATHFGDASAHDVNVGGFMHKETASYVSIKDSNILILDSTPGPSHQRQPDLNSNSEPRAGPSWKEQSVATETTDYTEFTARIKRVYKKFPLPGIAFLTEGESSVVNNFVELTLNMSGELIRREDIFNAINEDISKIILIEGQPGIGKSSLASKLSFDWAVGEDYIARHFKILLHLPLRKFQHEQSFEDEILEFGNYYGAGKKIENIIKDNEPNTLFLLDGLDEVSETNRYTILQLLYKKLYKYEHVNVLVTCKTGQFQLTETESKKLFPYGGKTSEFCDVKITVEGIKSVDMKEKFLAKFITNTNIRKDKIIGKLEKLSPNLDFFDSPLFLMLMAFIVSKEKNYNQVFTQKTELYKRLFNCIIKHNCRKNEISLGQRFDLFDVSPDSEDSVKKEKIGEFGCLSLEKIIVSDTTFVQDSFPSEIYDFGFLKKHKQTDHYGKDVNYEAFHLSILEFAAAYGVWINYKTKDNFDENITFIVKYFRYSNGKSLILPFLVGLLADDVDNLFQLSIFHNNFALNMSCTLSILEECQTIDTVTRILPYLKQFLPSFIDLTTVKTFNSKTVDVYREIFRFRTSCGNIEIIQIDDKIPLNIMEKFIFPNVRICKTLNENKLKQGFDAVYAKDLSSHESLTQILSCFSSSYVKTCQLRIFPRETKEFFKGENSSVIITMSSTSLPSSDKTNRVLFSDLEFEIQTKRQKEYLVKLLENNQVQYLNVNIFPAFKENMADIYRAISQSTYLTSLKLTGATEIDLKDLTNNGSKDFNELHIDCRLICSHPFQRQIDCRRLSCFNISVDSLIQIKPNYLTCSIETADGIMKKCPSWTGFQSVNYLKVRINTNIENFNALLAYENLQQLYIIVNVPVDLKMVVQCIKSLPQTKLVIDYKCLGVNICQSLFEFWEQNPKTDSNLEITVKCFYINIPLPHVELRLILNKTLENFNSFNEFRQIGVYDDSRLLMTSLYKCINCLLRKKSKLPLSKYENSDTINPNSKNGFEDCLKDMQLPICAEFRALIEGLEKNYWQSVCLEEVSEFQMTELALDFSKFDVIRFNFNEHITNFDKPETFPLYKYIITKKPDILEVDSK